MKKKPICTIATLLVCGAMTFGTPVTAWAATESLMEGPVVGAGKTIVTIDKAVNINKEHGNTEVLTQAKAGEVYDVIEDMGDGWVKVAVGNGYGYLPASGNATVTVWTEQEILAEQEAMKQVAESNELRRQVLVDYALQFVGGRYQYGGSDPRTGVDCSGFTRFVLQNGAGVTVNRSSSSQATQGVAVSADQMRPGDLIFYGNGRRINHVAMYIGNGQVVHSSTYETGIIVSPYNYRSIVTIKDVIGN